MKRLSIARKFYPRLRYIRINISKLLATLLQLSVMQITSLHALPVTAVGLAAVGLTGWAGMAQAETSSSGDVVKAWSVETVNAGGIVISSQL